MIAKQPQKTALYKPLNAAFDNFANTLDAKKN